MPEPSPAPALLMALAVRHVETVVMRRVAEAGHDITLAQGRLAARITDEGIRLTELAESAQMTKQAAGFLVDQLERGGYVERRPDPRDARARLVCFAERGRAVQAVAREAEEDIHREWEARLGPRRWRALHAALLDLRPLVDPWMPEADRTSSARGSR